jgi:hypothetical protein
MYYIAYTDNKEKAEKLTKELSKEDSMDSTAVIPPPISSVSVNLTISLVSNQEYLESAPGGVDAKFAWKEAGG